ncbi:hypothetical protein RUM43_008891 [Polyplax serrata]|uniref:Uncharacterized protein n=1 Tax=Polyplax serrata TaxID=468196 RepID=A0AAN8PVM0_POLSC
MADPKWSVALTIFAAALNRARAQDQVEDICYGTESVVVAVIGTLIVTLGLLTAGLFLYRSYWKTREGTLLPPPINYDRGVRR